jgi:adenosylcobinamide-phosphate synthase
VTPPAILALALLLAWSWDAAFGEPRNALHPVAWLGRVLGPVGGWLVRRSAAVAFSGGALAWIVFASGIAWAAAIWQQACAAWPGWPGAAGVALATLRWYCEPSSPCGVQPPQAQACLETALRVLGTTRPER